jgi:ferredoxin
MAYVVAEPCIKCKYTECVEICPVMCFYEGANFLTINPDECIDCGACVDPCPVSAIYPEEELPDKWHEYIEINARYSKEWPKITLYKDPMPTAETYKDKEDKRGELELRPGEGDPPM